MKKHLTFALALLTLISTSAHAQLPSYLPADGLVGWWPFNGNANDESGNGNDFNEFNVTPAMDRFENPNGAFEFNGIEFGGGSSLISNATLFNIGQPEYTIHLWFKVDDLTQITQALFNTSPHTGVVVSFNDDNVPGKLMYGVGPANAFWTHIYQQGQFSSFDTNSWYNVVFVKQGNNYRFYFNGVLENSLSNPQAANYNYDVQLRVSGISPDYQIFDGFIDDFALWNRALTEQEIQNLYTGSTPSACIDLPANLQAGLVGYWPFCGNANDESGNGNNGTVNGATLAVDRFGNAGSAYSFDGISNCIDVQHSSSLSIFGSESASTISLWFYPESNQLADLINKGFHSDVASLGNKYLSISNDVVGYQYTLYDFSTLNSVRPSDGYINTQQWYHMLIVRGANMKVYVNGIDVTTSPNDAGWLTNYNLVLDNTNMSFGCRNNKNISNVPFQSLFFQGKIDDITIYNRALSPEEVTQLYAVQSTGDPTAGGSLVTTGPLANVPRGISYQAVARDAQGQAIASSPVNVRFTLHQGTPTGTTEYSETHALTTNEIGLFSTYFGSGTAITSAFDSIVWSNSTKFLQVEIDLGNGYVDMGTQQLMSVPFAYRANEAAAAGTIRNNALPVYANNAAALAGGLAIGEMYRTATGDLKVVY